MSKFKPISFATFNNFDPDIWSNDHGIGDFEPTLAIQSERDNCDINIIMERFGQGVPVPVDVRPPMEGDFTGITDFKSAMNVIRSAQESFMEMPASVRSRFDNDPQKFLDFVYDPSNQDEAIKLGIAVDNRQQTTNNSSSVGDSTSDSASVA